MKLKVKKRKVALKKAPETRGKNEGNAKYQALSNEYEPEVEHKGVLVKETRTEKYGVTKTYVKTKVVRFDKDDGDNLGLPYVFIQMYQESEKGYTGMLKGKSVHFPLEMLYDVMDMLTEVSDTCDKLKIE